MRIVKSALAVLTLAIMAGCAEEEAGVVSEDPLAASLAIEQALSAEDRLARDEMRDQRSKPGEVLEFFGIEPGMKVLDFLGGGGYYAEILARVVGPEGRVTLHNNQAYLPYAREELDQRFLNGRMGEINREVVEINELDLAPGEYDAIVFILGFHDLYYADENWPAVDRPRLLAELYEGVRPGGVLGVVDHHAKEGSDPLETGQELHRIDPAAVRRALEGAGFVFEGESDVLANAADDLDVDVFKPEVRHKTSRFVQRYRKPAE